MNLTNEMLAEIESKANEATPGPWKWHEEDGLGLFAPKVVDDFMDSEPVCVINDPCVFPGHGRADADRAFIASANPATVLALVAEVRTLRGRCHTAMRIARERVAEVRRLRAELRAAALGWSREADPLNLNMRRARISAGLNPDPLTDFDGSTE